MKKKILLLLPFCLLLLAAVWGLAAGDAGDPLVSLSYLEGTFTDAVNSRVDQKLDASDAALLSGAELSVPSGDTSSWAESRLKQADACAPVKGRQGKQAADRHKPGLPDAGVVNIAVSEVSQAAFEGQKAALRILLDEHDAGAGSGVRVGENKPVVYAALLQRCAHHAPAVIVRHAG